MWNGGVKKGRIFYGCDRYPECDFVSWDKPSIKPCPSCDGLMVEKRTKQGTKLNCTVCDHSEMLEDSDEGVETS